MGVLITANLFDAFLRCETKFHLKLSGVPGIQREIIDWQQRLDDDFKRECNHRLRSDSQQNEYAANMPFPDVLQGKYKLAIECDAQTPEVQTRLNALERFPSNGKKAHPLFIPIRFVQREKITKHDKLLLGFDALVLSMTSGHTPPFGKIIYGTQQISRKIKVSGLMKAARSTVERITTLQAKNVTPQLILNKHCAECEYRTRCRDLAMEKDDLSLLVGMSERERDRHRTKGIFSVTQLAYTFRPRRRPRRFASKPERYHHSLKALAIRDKKIYVVGKPEFRLVGTPVYVDVEGIPDRNFYYLIGMRFKRGDSWSQRSFWADDASGEKTIWKEFLQALGDIEDPVLIHYGGYETKFLERMQRRYDEENGGSINPSRSTFKSFNLLSLIYAQIYFPTYSNGLKELAQYLGFRWSAADASGTQSIIWRYEWETSGDTDIKQKLVTYNSEDCQALETVVKTVNQLCLPNSTPTSGANIVFTDSLKSEVPPYGYRFGNPSFSIPELDYINKASYWNYQQNRIHVRSGKRPKSIGRTSKASRKASRHVNKVIWCPVLTHCPICSRAANGRPVTRTKIIYDIFFSRFGLKRWVVKYISQTHVCQKCDLVFGSEKRFRTRLKFGRNVVVYLIYQVVELRIPQSTVAQGINRLFGFDLKTTAVNKIKHRIAEYYADTQQSILRKIISGYLLHVDETKVTIRGKSAFVWVFTNLREVAYVYADSREGSMLQTLLAEFKGVLVSDFYAVYDSIACPQQKCLIHLIRDLNDEALSNPFNDELKQIVKDFALLLRAMIGTVDRYGLKRRFLRKHLVSVKRFYKQLSRSNYQSEIAVKYQKRLEKNRDKLFTFLNYDGVPWNNNNAEHAIKAFAALRNVIRGSSTEEGIKEYLILLSVCETCKNIGIDFLDFLRSGEKDVDKFVGSVDSHDVRLLRSIESKPRLIKESFQ